MSTNVIELTNQALSLPAQDRVQLAQKLWKFSKASRKTMKSIIMLK